MSAHTEKILKSTAVLVATKWAQRLFGIVSLVVLARVLGPDDFGIVALSAIVLSFFHAVSVTGAEQYLLSRSAVSADDADVAWTLNLLIKICASLAIVLVAPVAAKLFNEPRITLVLYVIAVLPTIDALANPGVFLKQRNYEYGAIALSQIAGKILSFIVTLFIAFKYQSYWALIAGNITNTVLRALFSYLIHPHRPKPKIKGIKKQWGFSKWMLARSIVGFSRAKADQFIAGMFFETKIVGAYNISKELVLMPFNQISEPLRPVFLSMFTNAKNSMDELRSSFTTKFIIMLAVMLPITCGMFLLRTEIVSLLLGSKWVGADQLIGGLVLLILTYSLTASSSAILVVLDRLKLLFVLDVITMCIVVFGQLLAKDFSVYEFAITRSVLGVLTFSVYFIAIYKTIHFNMKKLALGILPCLAGSLIMSCMILLQSNYLSGHLLLAAAVVTGIVVYAVTVFAIIRYLKDMHSDLNFIFDHASGYYAKFQRRLGRS